MGTRALWYRNLLLKLGGIVIFFAICNIIKIFFPSLFTLRKVILSHIHQSLNVQLRAGQQQQ
jgi:hypothetical protein